MRQVQPTVGLYGRPQHRPLAALALGCQAAGYGVEWRRANVFEPALAQRRFVAVVVYGLHGGGDIVVDAYERLQIPALVADLGHFRRAWSGHVDRSDGTGCYQLGVGRVAWLPPFPCPADRFDALEMTLEPRRRGEVVAILGQKPMDASHWLSIEEMRAWAQRTVVEIRAAGWQGPIVWRRHPRGQPIEAPEGVTAESEPDTESLAELLARSHAVVTNTSTAGLEALVAGVPVFCRADAMYADCGNLDLARITDPWFPSDAERRALCARVAYAQWTEAEMRTAAPIRFLLACAWGEVPVMAEGPMPAPPRPRRSRPPKKLNPAHLIGAPVPVSE